MNKSELVNILSARTGFAKLKCDRFLKEFKNLVFEVCSKGEQINLRGFGKFFIKERIARKFLNPQTKRYYLCAPKSIIAFKSYKNVR